MISDSKIEYLDKAFLGTSESLGFKNAKLAIKYVIFDDEMSNKETINHKDKWLFISNKYKGRDLAKKLHHLDLMHILIKYSYQHLGLKNLPFTIDMEKYQKLKETLFLSMALTTDELIEFIVYSALISVEEAYINLSLNKDLVLSILDLLITERYLENKREELDNFIEIPYPKMKMNEYEYYIKKFKSLDIEFSLLKRKDPSYDLVN